MRATVRECAMEPTPCMTLSAVFAFPTAASAESAERIRIYIGDQAVTATLNSSEAARDLVATLPLSIRVRDHLRREKTGPIPRPLSERTVASPNYQTGRPGLLAAGRQFRDLLPT